MDSSFSAHPESSSIARVLAELSAIHGLSYAAGEIERRLGRCHATAAPEDTEGDEFVRTAIDLGLRAKRVEATLEEVFEDVDVRRPAVLLQARTADDGGPRWLIVRGASRGRVERAWIGEDREAPYAWVSLRELREELGSDEADQLVWLLVDPANPASGASSASASTPVHPLPRLLRFLRPDRSDLIAVLAFSITTGVLLLATPVAVQTLVNFVALGGTPTQLLVVALLLFLGLALAGVLTAVQTWVVEILQRRVFVRAVAELAARLPRVQSQVYETRHGPELVNRFFDVVTIQKTSANLLLGGLALVLNMLVGLTVLAFYHPVLLAFDLLLVVVIALIVLGPIRRGIATATAESSAKYAVVAWLEELASNPDLFKSGSARRWAFERSDLLAGEYVRTRTSHFRVLFGQVVAAIGLQVIASTALLGIGGLLVMQGSLSLGQLVAAELIVTLVVSSVAKLGKHVESFYDLMAAVNKVGTLLDLPLEERGEERYRPDQEQRGSRLAVRDVSCPHPTGEPLLEGVTFDVAAGGTLGITGVTGTGKSTLVKLLQRLRDPARGTIQVDGRDLRTLSVESLRELVSVASPGQIVHASVAENVRLQHATVSDDDVRRALAAVGLTEAIGRLPEETRTELRQDGRPLSHGDAARLLIARALAGSPRVLVIDGLLDGLADGVRRDLCEVLFREDAPWTLIVTTNEAEVLERCDDVLELENGLKEKTVA